MASSSSANRLGDQAEKTYSSRARNFDVGSFRKKRKANVFVPQLPPGTRYHRQIAESYFKELLTKYLEEVKQEPSSPWAKFNTYEEVLASDIVFEDDFWEVICEALAQPYERKTPAILDAEGRPGTQLEPFSIYTVLNRMDGILTTHNRLRPHAPHNNRVTSHCRAFIHQELKETYKLKDPKQKHYATYDDVVRLGQHGVLGPQMHKRWKMPREFQQLAAIVSVIFFTGARPGDVIIAEGYQDKNDGLKWKDVAFERFYDDETKSWRLRADVTFRNLKGKKGKTDYRITPFHEHESMPTIVNPVRLLLVMAIDDGALETIESIEAVDQFDELRTPEADEERVIRYKVKDDKKELNVFRAFERVKGDGWRHHPSRGWTADAARHMLARVAPYAGLSKLTFKTLRYSTATALNRFDVNPNEAKLILGHNIGSTTMYDHYTSKRTTIDIIGLHIEGVQSNSATRAPGIEREVWVELSIEQELEIDNDAEMVALQERADYLRDGLAARYGSMSKAEASGDAKFGAYKNVYHQISTLRKQKQKEMRTRLAQEQERARVARLHQAKASASDNCGEGPSSRPMSGPVAAHEAESPLQGSNNAALQEDAEAAAGVTANGDDDDNDEEEADVELPEDDEEDNASDNDDDDEQPENFVDFAESAFGGRPNQASTQRTSATQLPTRPAEECTTVAEMVDSCFKVVNVQSQALSAIYARHQACAESNQILLLVGPDKPSFAVAANELQSWSRCSARHQVPAHCPTCEKALTRKHAPEHMPPCEEKMTDRKVRAAIIELITNKPCPVKGCKLSLSYKNEISYDHHVLTSHDQNSKVCGFTMADGSACTFPIKSIDANTMDGALLRVHRQLAHGWHGSLSHVVDRFKDTEPLLIGAVAIQLRAEELLKQHTERKYAIDTKHHCGICLHDAKLSPSQRMHDHGSATRVAQHIARCHILPVRSEYVSCYCGEVVHASHFIEHLANHGYKLGTKGKTAKTPADLDKGFKMGDRQVEELDVFLSSLPPPPNDKGARITDVSNVGHVERRTKREISKAFAFGPRKKRAT